MLYGGYMGENEHRNFSYEIYGERVHLEITVFVSRVTLI